MGHFLYVPPVPSLMYAAVTGTVDADFNANWLTDGLPGFPVKVSGAIDLTITPSAALTADLFAVCHHNIPAGVPVTLSDVGSPSSTLVTVTPSDWPDDDIPQNPWTRLDTPIVLSTARLEVAAQGGSPADGLVIGELFGGLAQELEYELFIDQDWDESKPFPWESASLAPYDDGTSDPRRIRAQTIVSDIGMAAIRSWYRSTRRGTLPTLIVPDDRMNDAWLAQFQYSLRPMWLADISSPMTNESLIPVTFEFVELPRTRW